MTASLVAHVVSSLVGYLVRKGVVAVDRGVIGARRRCNDMDEMSKNFGSTPPFKI